MNRWVAAILVASAAINAQANVEPENIPPKLRELRAKALQNDYYAQRNLAYAYANEYIEAGWPLPVAACAWYLTIPYVNPARMHAGDSGNAQLSCRALDPMQFDQAIRYSSDLVKQLGAKKTR